MINSNINIYEYAEILNDKTNKIDIKFMKEFIELVDKEEFCIHYKKLEEYGAYIFKSSNIINRLLKKNNFEENIDYMFAPEASGANIGSGGSNKKEYYL